MSEIVSLNDNGWCRQEKVHDSTPSKATGKINLHRQPIFSSHRSGWAHAVNALEPLHSDSGVYFDGFLEKNFAWERHSAIKTERIPYRHPWVGFFHNPIGIPEWFFSQYSLEKIIQQDEFQESLAECLGIYTLSKGLAQDLSKYLKVPIDNLIHPTEIPEARFDFDKFIDNAEKKVVTVGWWLRKLNSIYALPLEEKSGYRKVRLLTYTAKHPQKVIEELVVKERYEENLFMDGSIALEYESNTLDMPRLNDDEYDNLLSENVVFLDLYSSSANNAVIECIARGTPLLINKLPSTIEYLGEDYPFYFDTLEEAAEKAKDFNLIRATHEYLTNLDIRDKLSSDYFRNSLVNGEIYKSL